MRCYLDLFRFDQSGPGDAAAVLHHADQRALTLDGGDGPTLEQAVAIAVGRRDEEIGVVPVVSPAQAVGQALDFKLALEGLAVAADIDAVDRQYRYLLRFGALEEARQLRHRVRHDLDPIIHDIASRCAVHTSDEAVVIEIFVRMQLKQLPREKAEIRVYKCN